MGLRRSIGVTIALLGMLSAAPAHAEWWEATTNHFVIVSESSEADARQFAEKLERFDNALRLLQNMPLGKEIGAANKVTVYRYGDITDIGFLAGAGAVAGFYIPRAGQPVAFAPAIERMRRDGSLRGPRADDPTALDALKVQFHEYTHHFMLQNFPAAYPGWYIEGFAELYGTLELRDDGSFHVGNPPNHRATQIFRMLQMPVPRLLDSKSRFQGAEWLQQYSLGWLLTHYLSFSKEREGQLTAYLKAIGAGEDSLTAARRIFGDLDQLDREVRRYRSGRFPGLDVKPAAYTPPVVRMRKLDASEEATIRLQLRLKRGVTRKEARGLADDADALAQRHGASLVAQLIAAEANLDAQRFDAAILAADRALAINASSVGAMILKARAMIENKAGDPSRFTKARDLLRSARELDPEDPRPLIEYYASYREAGGPIPETAIIALEDAFERAAYDSQYRLTLGRQLLSENKGKLARNVIAPVAVAFHGSDPERNLPARVVELIDAGDLEAAKAKLAEIFAKQEEEKNKLRVGP